MVVPCIYDDVEHMRGGMAPVKKGDKWGFVNSQGKEITPIIFEKASICQGGFAFIVLNGKMGFVNNSGAPLKVDLSSETYYSIGSKCESKWKEHDLSTNIYLKEAIKWFKKSSLKGNEFAGFKVGYYNFTGAIGKKDYAEAVKWFERAIKPNSNSNGNEYLLLGIIYENGGFGIEKNILKALKYYKDGGTLKKNADCYNNLACLYIKKHNSNDAISAIDKAIALKSNIADYYDTKGEIYLMMGKDEEALKMWKKVMELDPNFLHNFPEGTELYNKLKAKGKIK